MLTDDQCGCGAQENGVVVDAADHQGALLLIGVMAELTVLCCFSLERGEEQDLSMIPFCEKSGCA